ncbi:hypothetical protein CSH63_33030 [Micromonospora tulbaghiae]|uniref:Uncharacterized protein n=1 Tax=Micromonospora tulbaghiae TaxID=479978 RepID=A0A386WXL7_9ACTN|nr:hypothetical protein [Micromonospora tulbaghiae]AYF32180.1 hypothetical protein CSH63_33030 [Micromonospora tulbaghiae]
MVLTVDGPCGRATRLDIPDRPDAAQTTDWWLITAPGYHTIWSQYGLLCVRLDDDVPGFPPPKRQFPQATHELLVLTLDPTLGVHTPDSVIAGGLRYLSQPNIVEQYTAGDNEMRELCEVAVHAVVHGQLNPETANDPSRIRGQWHEALRRALAGIRPFATQEPTRG